MSKSFFFPSGGKSSKAEGLFISFSVFICFLSFAWWEFVLLWWSNQLLHLNCFAWWRQLPEGGDLQQVQEQNFIVQLGGLFYSIQGLPCNPLTVWNNFLLAINAGITSLLISVHVNAGRSLRCPRASGQLCEARPPHLSREQSELHSLQRRQTALLRLPLPSS